MELEKRNTLILSVAQGLSITTTSINMINTGLVGAMLATNPSYSTIPLSLQFLTIALTLIPVSLLMGKFGRRSMFLLGSLAAFIGCLIIAFSIIDKSFYLFILGIFPTAAATFLRIVIIRTAGPVFMTLTNFQVPVWSVFFSILILNEPFKISMLAALALILSGLLINQTSGIKDIIKTKLRNNNL